MNEPKCEGPLADRQDRIIQRRSKGALEFDANRTIAVAYHRDIEFGVISYEKSELLHRSQSRDRTSSHDRAEPGFASCRASRRSSSARCASVKGTSSACDRMLSQSSSISAMRSGSDRLRTCFVRSASIVIRDYMWPRPTRKRRSSASRDARIVPNACDLLTRRPQCGYEPCVAGAAGCFASCRDPLSASLKSQIFLRFSIIFDFSLREI